MLPPNLDIRDVAGFRRVLEAMFPDVDARLGALDELLNRYEVQVVKTAPKNVVISFQMLREWRIKAEMEWRRA